MENAVIYARYSSHNQTENSIEAQVAEAKQYANSKKYNIVKVYADRAKTGTNDNREAFQQMLSDTNQKIFSVIIVWKVDRFGRNREEIALNKYKCKKNGVRVEYVAENISDGPEGVILESVLEGFAEYYSRQLSQNTKRGLKNKALKGEYTGGPCPYGYKIVDGKFTVDEPKAKKIKEVFKLFNSGLNFSEVGRRLHLEPYNVKFFLSNEVYYTGTYKRCGVEIENIIPKLVTAEEFQMAASRMSHYTKKRKPLKYLLTGKLYCSCGGKYKGSSSPTLLYYRCKCSDGKMRSVKKNIIEEDALKKCYEILKSPESIEELTDKVYEKIKQRVKTLNSGAKYNSLLKKKRNLLNLVEEGALPGDDPDLRERLRQLDLEIKECCFTSGTSTQIIINRNDVKLYIEALGNLNGGALVEAFITKIVVDETTREWTIECGPIGLN